MLHSSPNGDILSLRACYPRQLVIRGWDLSQEWLRWSLLDFLCNVSFAEYEKPLSGQQEDEGLLKAFLRLAVGSVCVWESDSQGLNMYSAMCYASQRVGVGRRCGVGVYVKKCTSLIPQFFILATSLNVDEAAFSTLHPRIDCLAVSL